jgi:hypothetical protein
VSRVLVTAALNEYHWAEWRRWVGRAIAEVGDRGLHLPAWLREKQEQSVRAGLDLSRVTARAPDQDAIVILSEIAVVDVPERPRLREGRRCSQRTPGVAKLTAVCGRRGAKHPFPVGAGVGGRPSGLLSDGFQGQSGHRLHALDGRWNGKERRT